MWAECCERQAEGQLASGGVAVVAEVGLQADVEVGSVGAALVAETCFGELVADIETC